MARLSEANVLIAREIIGRVPRPKSALIPLLHLAQEQDGHVTTDAMAHLAELIGITPAEVYGTASFYEMFKFEPVGKLLHQHLHQHLLPAPRGLGAAGARRGAARHQGRQHDGGRAVHGGGRGVHRRLHRGAGPPRELPLPLQGVGRRLRPARRGPARPATWTTRSHRTAPWRASARRCPPTAGPAPARRPRPRSTPDERIGWCTSELAPRARAGAEWAGHRHQPLRRGRRLHVRRLRAHAAATRRCATR